MDKIMCATEKLEYERIWAKVKNIIPQNSSVLVTGANGLIASNLVDSLMYFNEAYATNNMIIALCRNEEKARKRFGRYLKSGKLNIWCQDICEFDMNQTCDYVVHAASNAHPLAYATKPIETMRTNFIGTMKVLDYASEKKAKSVVYISTSEIYGENHKDRLNEQEYGSVNTLNPRSCYSESKRSAETLCVCYSKEKNLDVKIVRPGYIYGAQITEDNSRADAQFLRNVIADENIVMKSEGKQKRSYCYVSDAVSAILYVMLLGKTGEAYNIANTNSEASIREYAEMLAIQGGVKLVFDIPSENEKRGYSVVNNSLLSDTKLRNLGWIPQYNLQQGIEQMLNNSKWRYKDND